MSTESWPAWLSKAVELLPSFSGEAPENAPAACVADPAAPCDTMRNPEETRQHVAALIASLETSPPSVPANRTTVSGVETLAAPTANASMTREPTTPAVLPLSQVLIRAGGAGVGEAALRAKSRTNEISPLAPFVPLEVKTLQQTGLRQEDIEGLLLKMLRQSGTATGRALADQIALPFLLIQELLGKMKAALQVGYKAAAERGDFVYELTVQGRENAGRFAERSRYCGAAPVPLDQYVDSVKAQSVCRERVTFPRLREAFGDLSLHEDLVTQVGEALTAGKGMFLYGPPGNGKTSIAERLSQALGNALWIPQVISAHGELIRLFDPSQHEIVPTDSYGSMRIDRRWVLVRRPTIVVGGELTLEHLDIRYSQAMGLNEAPIHLKSNGGTLVIDDFGRQRVSTVDLLNRWIVPLEKRIDYLHLTSGRQIAIPFEQFLVFSTNLEPRDLVDEAFLRRIPYKVSVHDPSLEEFVALLRSVATNQGVEFLESPVREMIARHFTATGRPLRYCHARDLTQQVVHRCRLLERPAELSTEHLEAAVKSYFAVM